MSGLLNTNVRKKDLQGLSHTALVDALWQIVKDIDETVTTYGDGYDREDRRGLCVVSGDEVFNTIEEKVDR